MINSNISMNIKLSNMAYVLSLKHPLLILHLSRSVAIFYQLYFFIFFCTFISIRLSQTFTFSLDLPTFLSPSFFWAIYPFVVCTYICEMKFVYSLWFHLRIYSTVTILCFSIHDDRRILWCIAIVHGVLK